MTGKELLIALVGSGLVGGAAGLAATMAVPAKQAVPEQPNEELIARVKAAEDQLAQTKADLDREHKSFVELQERVVKSEMDAAKREAAAASQPTKIARGPIRVGRRGASDGKAEAQIADDVQKLVGNFDNVDFAGIGDAVTVELGDALDGLGAELGGAGAQLAGLRNGFEMRKLPEDKRWEKAKDDLGLTWNQVEDLKKAVAARDAAMKDANTVEKKAGPNGGTITISRPDASKTAHAQADYHDKVNATLNEDQRKNWQSKGYDHAFGKGGLGGAMVMAVDVQTDRTDKSGDPLKPETK